MFLLLGVLPILTALIGFIVIPPPAHPNVAGVKTTQTIISPTATFTPTPTITSASAPIESFSELKFSSGPRLTSTPSPVPTKAPAQVPNSTSDLLTQVNDFRVSKGLASFTANDETCFFAKLRANEISSNFSHDGFRNRIDSKSLPYSSWSEVAENIAVNPNPEEVVQGWINSPGHNENLSKNVPYGCVSNSGHYYVFEAWAP